MTAVSAARAGTRRVFEIGPLLALFGVGAALAIGLAVGSPTVDQRLLGAEVIGVMAIASALLWPFAALQVILASVILLVVWVVTGNRAVNPIDVLMPPVLLASLAGGARARARFEDDPANGRAHPGIVEAIRRLTRSVVVFYALAVLSLVALAFRGHPDWAADSFLSLIRGIQGLVFFALGTWWIRTEKEIRVTERSLQVAAWILIVVDVFYMATQGVARAGMTWILNYSEWPITSPNEAALSLLLVWAVLLAQPKRERGLFQWLYLAVAPIILALTQSRSGLIAWSVFVVLSTRWWRWKTLIGILVIVGLVVLFAPEAYWGRLSRTLSPKGGSFEAFSSIIRVYGWQAALKILADNPIFGVGYMGFRFLSAKYNDLGIVIGTAENYYLEVAVGMGMIGLAALLVVLVMLWRIGHAVRAVTPPGSHGHELARRHGPMVLALLAVNLTGDQFVGMTGLAQLSLWIVLVVRAGHMSAAPAART